MKDREYRELQLSSSHLVLIFLTVIALGVVIFLLGISVGKKQAQAALQSHIPALNQEETVPVKPAPVQEKTAAPQEDITQELESHQKIREEKRKPPAETPKAEAQKNMYYIQVGAYSRKAGADALAEKFRSRGYSVLVMDPFPTDRRSIYRVRVGGFPTREKAVEVKNELARLENKKSTDYFVIQF